MKSDTGKYCARQTVMRKRYRAVVRLHNGQMLIARGIYSGMLEAETAASRWVNLLNVIYPNTRLQQIKRVKNVTS